MNPYRAVYVYLGPATGDRKLNAERTMIEEPVVVVGGYYEPATLDHAGSYVSWGGYRLVAVAQKDGRHLTDDPGTFRCTEPGYLGLPIEDGPDHDHVLGVGRPILEGGRQVGIERRCTVPGCDHLERAAPVKRAGQ